MVSPQKWNLLNAIIFVASSRFRSQLTIPFSHHASSMQRGAGCLRRQIPPIILLPPPCSPPTLQTWPGRSSRVTGRPRPLEQREGERAREVGNCAHQTSIHSIPLRPSVPPSVRPFIDLSILHVFSSFLLPIKPMPHCAALSRSLLRPISSSDSHSCVCVWSGEQQRLPPSLPPFLPPFTPS